MMVLHNIVFLSSVQARAMKKLRKIKSYSPKKSKQPYMEKSAEKHRKSIKKEPENELPTGSTEGSMPIESRSYQTESAQSSKVPQIPKMNPAKQRAQNPEELTKKSVSIRKKSATDKHRLKKSSRRSTPTERKSMAESSNSSKSSSNSSITSINTPTKQQLIKKNREKAKKAFGGVQKREENDSGAEAKSNRSVEALATPDQLRLATAEESNSTRAPPSLRLSGRHPDLISKHFKQFAWECEQSTIDSLKAQFEALPKPDPKEYRVGADPKNTGKNRYKDIVCLDATRIVLRFPVFEKDSNYIHANRVEYRTLKNTFIITQGPLSKTIIDFWRMIWQEKVESILMLCQHIEKNRKKSAEYFNNNLNVPMVLSNGLKVTLVEKRRYEIEELLTCTIQVDYNGESRKVLHYQWTEWPDQQAPTASVRPMFTMLRKVRRNKYPVVVHCSAGIGRSGTLVALEMCLMDIARGDKLNVQNVVASLRRCRALAVQVFEQYLAIIMAVLEFGVQNGCIKKDDAEHFFRLYFAVVLDN